MKNQFLYPISISGIDRVADDALPPKRILVCFHEKLISISMCCLGFEKVLFMCSLGLVNQPVKFDTKWLLKFETDYQTLFETNANQGNDAVPTSVDAKFILTSTPYIFYDQFKLDDNYKAYLKGIMISNNILRTGIQVKPYQKVMNWFLAASLEQ